AEQYRIVDPIIGRRRNTGADDLLGRLQAARDPESGAPLSAGEIRDQVLVFLLAGHETTAGALTFTLHQLGLHPEIQDRVAADDDLIRPALLEGMRLFPPVYGTERLTGVDTTVGGYDVPAGYGVMVSPYVTH